MQLIVEAPNRPSFVVNVAHNELVDELCNRIHESIGIPPYRQSLVFESKNLENGRYLSDYDISSGDIVRMYLLVRGGSGKPARTKDNVSDLEEEMKEVKVSSTASNSKSRSSKADSLLQYVLWPSNHPEDSPSYSSLKECLFIAETMLDAIQTGSFAKIRSQRVSADEILVKSAMVRLKQEIKTIETHADATAECCETLLGASVLLLQASAEAQTVRNNLLVASSMAVENDLLHSVSGIVGTLATTFKSAVDAFQRRLQDLFKVDTDNDEDSSSQIPDSMQYELARMRNGLAVIQAMVSMTAKLTKAVRSNSCNFISTDILLPLQSVASEFKLKAHFLSRVASMHDWSGITQIPSISDQLSLAIEIANYLIQERRFYSVFSVGSRYDNANLRMSQVTRRSHSVFDAIKPVLIKTRYISPMITNSIGNFFQNSNLVATITHLKSGGYDVQDDPNTSETMSDYERVALLESVHYINTGRFAYGAEHYHEQMMAHKIWGPLIYNAMDYALVITSVRSDGQVVERLKSTGDMVWRCPIHGYNENPTRKYKDFHVKADQLLYMPSIIPSIIDMLPWVLVEHKKKVDDQSVTESGTVSSGRSTVRERRKLRKSTSVERMHMTGISGDLVLSSEQASNIRNLIKGGTASDDINNLYDIAVAAMNKGVQQHVLDEEETQPMSKVIVEAVMAIMQLDVMHCVNLVDVAIMNDMAIPSIACADGVSGLYLVKRDLDYNLIKQHWPIEHKMAKIFEAGFIYDKVDTFDISNSVDVIRMNLTMFNLMDWVKIRVDSIADYMAKFDPAKIPETVGSIPPEIGQTHNEPRNDRKNVDDDDNNGSNTTITSSDGGRRARSTSIMNVVGSELLAQHPSLCDAKLIQSDEDGCCVVAAMMHKDLSSGIVFKAKVRRMCQSYQREGNVYTYLWNHVPSMHRYLADPITTNQSTNGYNEFRINGEIVSVLVTQYCRSVSRDQFSTESDVLWFVSSLLSALATLHDDAKVIHGDISPGNVMMSGEDVKLIDFEFSHMNVNQGEFVESYGWTDGYFAPEVHDSDDVVSFASDVFSAGKVIERACVSSTLKSLGLHEELNQMTRQSPESRPRAQEVLTRIHGMKNRKCNVQLVNENVDVNHTFGHATVEVVCL